MDGFPKFIYDNDCDLRHSLNVFYVFFDIQRNQFHKNLGALIKD